MKFSFCLLVTIVFETLDLSALFVGSLSSLPSAVIIHQKGKKTKKFELQDYVTLKINQMEKEASLHPNVLLAQIVELEGDCAKIITKFGFLTIKRLGKKKYFI